MTPPKAVETLTKDQDQLLTFFGFPAEHWIHLRTTNPIESPFAAVKEPGRRRPKVPVPGTPVWDGVQAVVIC